MAKKIKTDEARFLEKIDVDRNGCWIWRGMLDTDGYGSYRIGSRSDGSRRLVRAHRWAYEHWVGSIQDKLVVDHLCRIRNCVNPEHMQLVSSAQNTHRGQRASATHCKNEHPLSGNNVKLIWNRSDQRYQRRCRKCLNAYARAWRKRSA